MEKKEIIETLQSRGKEQETLFAEARSLRHKNFGDKVVVRGVIEVTDACRNNCDYCPMGKNSKNNRYIMSSDEIVEASKSIKDAGLKVVFLQGGEVPETTETIGEAIPRIRDLFHDNVEILLGLGNKSKVEYGFLKKQGADAYILKYETSDSQLHYNLRHVTLDARLRCLKDLLDLRYKVGTGAIVGLPGQTLEILADDILFLGRYEIQMSSCSPFIPAEDTPLQGCSAGDIETTLNTLALMRIVNPSALIPSVSALERIQKNGQLRGLNAGTNVITINYTPGDRRKVYRIYGRDRYIVEKEYALDIIRKAGLES